MSLPVSRGEGERGAPWDGAVYGAVYVRTCVFKILFYDMKQNNHSSFNFVSD